MKSLLIVFAFLFIVTASYGQNVVSGNYNFGLKLSYNAQTQTLTGYFENYTGWDFESKQHKYSCIFYIKGTTNNKRVEIVTYYPEDAEAEKIKGYLEISNDSTIIIKLEQEHGGCWNVLSFANEPIEFKLQKKANWTDIKYVIANKAYLHSDTSPNKKQKAYLIKNDFVCIDNVQGSWAYCKFFGKKTTKGWIKLSDLNK
jgi:hypothetical protein